MGKEDEQQGTFLLQLSCPCSQAEEALPASIKESTLAQKSLEPPPPQSRNKGASGDLEGHWKHLVPKPGCEEYPSKLERKGKGYIAVPAYEGS
eukprot:1152404-Pelagomonas_calceolata.AAC.2